MVYLRCFLSILLPSWLIHSFCLIFLCQFISSSTKIDNRALTIVKSIDDYFCQNYIFTCFFRQRYHQLFDHEQCNKYKSFLILYSCLQYDIDSLRICERSIVSQVQRTLINKIPKYCFTSSVYKTLSTQHLHSIALPKTIIHCRIFVFFFVFILFAIRRRMYY